MSTFQIPSTMKALVQHDTEPKAVIKQVPVPKLDKNEVLIKVAYIAQNPIDWKLSSGGMIPPNAILGFDLAGTIVALGDEIANTKLKVGDPVAGMVMGGSGPDKGAFAEYAKAESDLLWTVPESITLGEAAGVSATLGTAAQSLFHILELPYPIHPSNPSRASPGSTWILIYGGSSSVGLFAIQLAKFAGFKVITVCSPRNFELVKQHGADAIVDYSDAKATVGMITRTTQSRLTLALDCISAGDSASICIEALVGGDERKVVSVGPPSDSEQQLATERGIKWDRVMAWTLFGRPVPLGPDFTIPAKPLDRAFFAKLNSDLPVLFEKYGLKVNPITDMDGGLEAIPAGFEKMKAGISGSKLVYKLADV